MDDDKTVIMRTPGSTREPPTCDASLEVNFNDENGRSIDHIFTERFVIGRHTDCDLIILDDEISRHHVECYPARTRWVVKDLNSTNGTFLNGKLIKEAPLAEQAILQLGDEGPVLTLKQFTEKKHEVESPPVTTSPASEKTATEADVIDHYLSDKPKDNMGEHTLMVRNVIQQVQKKQSLRYGKVIAGFAVIVVVMLGLLVMQQSRLQKARDIAVDMFYDMKTLEVQIAQTEEAVQRAGRLSRITDIQSKRNQLVEMERKYQNYLQELDSARWFKRKLSDKQRIILAVAREFGECEIELPDGFAKEVENYIAKWQSSDRFLTAINRMKQRGYQEAIVSALQSNHLSTQFAYLPLQESNFRSDAIGPETRFGIAKGAWQFIPDTATQYGLKIGPLAAVRKYDPADERFNFQKASQAAARYLKDIYSQEAQASGLLVLASYNWGDNRVRKLIQKMPDNPKERNFWKLIQQYKIPQETYDYVFYIYSAAVIGKNPRLFGFDFDDPFEVVS